MYKVIKENDIVPVCMVVTIAACYSYIIKDILQEFGVEDFNITCTVCERKVILTYENSERSIDYYIERVD